jgi:hypothetical protein
MCLKEVPVRKQFWSLVVKALAFQLLFVILHFAYAWFPSPVVAVFSGTSEAFVQHAKIGFWAYSLACLLEYALRRKRISSLGSFTLARLLACVMLPWIMFLLWYIAPSFRGPMSTGTLEIIYANIVTFGVGLAAATLERDLERVAFSPAVRGVIMLLYLLSAILLTTYTFRLPWADFFRG